MDNNNNKLLQWGNCLAKQIVPTLEDEINKGKKCKS